MAADTLVEPRRAFASLPLATARPLRRVTQRGRAAFVGVFLIGFGVRLLLVLTSPGGLGGDFGYDPGVYYTASDALLHGRMPYSAFTMLHPPALMLALTPFAALGRLTTDHTGFVTATVAFELLGGANAALVYALARRLGLRRVAAVLGGCFYAVWFAAAYPEITIRLEPLGTFAFLLGLTVLTGSRRTRSRVVGGALLAVAVGTKIWWVVPVAVVLVWWLAQRRTRRHSPSVLLGVAIGLTAVYAPFFLAAPGAMWHMVVTDQLGRAHIAPLATRLRTATTLHSALPGLHGGRLALGEVAAVLLAALLLATAARVPQARLVVVIAAAQVIVLVLSPSFFSYYTGFAASGLSLVVAAAAHGAGGRLARRGALALAATAVVTAAALTLMVVLTTTTSFSTRFPRAAVRASVASAHCVAADSPMSLVETDLLSRDLDRGCPNWVDVTGRTYGADVSSRAHPVSRERNPVWQRDLRGYLLSGDALILTRPSTGLGPALERTLSTMPLVVSGHHLRTYLVTRPAP